MQKLSKTTHGVTMHHETETSLRKVSILRDDRDNFILKIDSYQDDSVPLNHTLYLSRCTIDLLTNLLNEVQSNLDVYKFEKEEDAS